MKLIWLSLFISSIFWLGYASSSCSPAQTQPLKKPDNSLLCSVHNLQCVIEICSSKNKLQTDQELCLRIKGQAPCTYDGLPEVEKAKIIAMIDILATECQIKKWPEDKITCSIVEPKS